MLPLKIHLSIFGGTFYLLHISSKRTVYVVCEQITFINLYVVVLGKNRSFLFQVVLIVFVPGNLPFEFKMTFTNQFLQKATLHVDTEFSGWRTNRQTYMIPPEPILHYPNSMELVSDAERSVGKQAKVSPQFHHSIEFYYVMH